MGMGDNTIFPGQLLSCPFCGSADIWVVSDAEHGDAMVECHACKASSGHYDSTDALVATWNTRAKLPEESDEALTGWIPCSERLPPDTDCIVYEANSGRVLMCCGGEWEASDWNVTHWMPLTVLKPPNPTAI